MDRIRSDSAGVAKPTCFEGQSKKVEQRGKGKEESEEG